MHNKNVFGIQVCAQFGLCNERISIIGLLYSCEVSLMEAATRFRTVVFAIAPHLIPRIKSRHRRRKKRLPMSSLRQSLTPSPTRDVESDEPLSDDSEGVRQLERSEEYRHIMARTAVDGHGEVVLRRAPRRTTASDTSSSFCMYHSVPRHTSLTSTVPT